MDEPFLPPRKSKSQSLLPPEFLMPLPFCKLICNWLTACFGGTT